jgi:hypothetical protein
MPLLLGSRFLAPAGCLLFDYIREARIMEGLIQAPAEEFSPSRRVVSEMALSQLVGK